MLQEPLGTKDRAGRAGRIAAPVAAVLALLWPLAAGAGDGEPLVGTRSHLGFAPSTMQPEPLHGWKVEVHPRPAIADEFRASVGDRIFFAPGSSELSPRAKAVLKAQAAWLKRHPDLVVTVEAHADDPGSALDNRMIAERRADVVRRKLLEDGVTPDRLKTVAYGKERPVALCREVMCSAQNRRAVSQLDEIDVASRAAAGRATIGDDRARGSLSR